MPESKLSASASASTARSAGSLGIRFVYLLATIQFVWFYLAHVPAAMQMAAYEQGHERTPFQYRALMMAPMLLAHHAAVFASAANWLTRLPGWFSGSVSPEGVMQALVDCLSLVIKLFLRRLLLPRKVLFEFGLVSKPVLEEFLGKFG